MLEGTAGRVERIGRERVRVPGLSARSPIRHLDPTLLVIACALTAFGAVAVYSATLPRLAADGFPSRTFLDRQIVFGVAGVGAMVAVASFGYRRLRTWGWAFYSGCGVLLAFVLGPLGSEVAGAQRWIALGFFQFQPSEVAKLAVVIAVAGILARGRGDPGIGHVAGAVAAVVVPAALIYRQPDIGTLLVLIAILAGMLLVAGTKLRLLLAMAVLAGVTFWGILHLGLLEEYQVARLTAFLDPSSDLQRTGYNLNQAKIAIGSGQLVGKGLFNGTQTNLDFVPEVHTDFVFTVVGEETGFVGAAILLGLFAVFLWRGIRIAMLSKDLYGTLLAAGVVSMLVFQIFVNVGMTIGVSPITGIPLPFISYGGSSLITTLAATGILLNVHMRRV